MSGVETRSVSRNSLFLLANIRVEDKDKVHRVRVRNLSDGGMMGEGDLRVQRGNRLHIELRNVDPVTGSVAWVQDDRFGIAFDEEIDSEEARRPSAPDGFVGTDKMGVSDAHRAPARPADTPLRKV